MSRTVISVIVAIILLILIAVWFYLDRTSAQLLIPLLIAGGLASVVQALIENKNTLALPKPVDGGYDLGFVADLLIGMVGAFASLIIGLAVLNDRFFHDPIGPVVTTPSGGSGADASREFAAVVMSIPTWVRIASFGALTLSFRGTDV